MSIAKLDLTGLRAGDVINYNGHYYDVDQLHLYEHLEYRDPETGEPRSGWTSIKLSLRLALWLALDESPPGKRIIIGDPWLSSLVINGCSYRIDSWSQTLQHVRDRPDAPAVIEASLVRTPYNDPTEVT